MDVILAEHDRRAALEKSAPKRRKSDQPAA
jgi:hypothetical protein